MTFFCCIYQVDDEAMELNKELISKLLELDDVDAVYSDQKWFHEAYDQYMVMSDQIGVRLNGDCNLFFSFSIIQE